MARIIFPLIHVRTATSQIRMTRTSPFHARAIARLKTLLTGTRGGRTHGTLPRELRARLSPVHPRLRELRRRAAVFDPEGRHISVWTDIHLIRDLDLRAFRADNAYVWQHRQIRHEDAVRASARYLASRDRLGVLDRCVEDGMFGAETWTDDQGRMVSRDLLDSGLELNALEAWMGISRMPGLRMLDIGAGYGRLAVRAAEVLGTLETCVCTDAVPESTFVCECYVEYRQAGATIRVVPLDEIERTLEESRFDVAVNVCSFSECPLEGIDWWVQRLARAGIPRLFIVPIARGDEGRTLTSMERDGRMLDMLPVFDRHGYVREACIPKYADPEVQQAGVSPTHYHLFTRGNA